MTRRRKHPDVGGVRRASIGLAVRLGALMLLLFMISGAVILVIVGVTQAAARDQLLAETADRIDSSHDAPAGVWVAIEHDGMLDVSPDMPAGLPDREAMAHPGPPDHGVQRTVVVGQDEMRESEYERCTPRHLKSPDDVLVARSEEREQ